MTLLPLRSVRTPLYSLRNNAFTASSISLAVVRTCFLPIFPYHAGNQTTWRYPNVQGLHLVPRLANGRAVMLRIKTNASLPPQSGRGFSVGTSRSTAFRYPIYTTRARALSTATTKKDKDDRNNMKMDSSKRQNESLNTQYTNPAPDSDEDTETNQDNESIPEEPPTWQWHLAIVVVVVAVVWLASRESAEQRELRAEVERADQGSRAGRLKRSS